MALDAPNESAAVTILPASIALLILSEDFIVFSKISISVFLKLISLNILVLSTVIKSVISIPEDSKETIPI